MARPTPQDVRRQPMAPAQPAVAYRPAREGAATQVFTAAGLLDPDALFRALEGAEFALEGATYVEGEVAGTRIFLGSASVTLNVAAPAAMAKALTSDRRARDVLRARLAREAAGMLGAEAPTTLRLVELRAVIEGARVRVDCDLEGAVARRKAALSR